MAKYILRFLLCCLPAVAVADDTELFFAPVDGTVKVMLLVDTSGSMGWVEGASGSNQNTYRGDCSDGGGSNRKICILKNQLRTFLQASSADAWPDNLEVGLAQYAEPGGIILAPLARLDAPYNAQGSTATTQRQHLLEVIDRLKVGEYSEEGGNSTDLGDSTPLIGSYLEVAEYLRGGTPVSPFSVDHSAVSSWAAGLAGDQYAGVELTPTCGSNHVIVLTDGESTCEKTGQTVHSSAELGNSFVCSSNSSNVVGSNNVNGVEQGDTLGKRVASFYGSLSGGYVDTDNDAYLDVCADDIITGGFESQGSYWGCLNAVADKLNRLKNSANESTSIKTHVISYGLNTGSGSDLTPLGLSLKDWADKGSGSFFSAQSGSDLKQALGGIVESGYASGSYTIASGAVGVNLTNQFSYLDEIYFSMFTPSGKPFWYGNLKKYFYDFDEDDAIGIFVNPGKTIEAVRDGVFLPNVNSIWSDVFPANYHSGSVINKDGNIAHIGGAASQIEPAVSRRLYTYIDDTRHRLPAIDSQSDSVAAIKAFMVADAGTDAPADYSNKVDRILSWLQGDDVLDEWLDISGESNDTRAGLSGVRTLYGAPLHGSPVVVNYKSFDSAGEALNDPDDIVFVSTNDGKLYALDTDTGEEKLAFLPQAMLRRQNGERSAIERMYDAINNDVPGGLIYGLDSTWTVWRQDMPDASGIRDGNISSGAGSADFVRLFGGMRRGGRNYYVLDATGANNANPEIEQIKVIEGGIADTAFENIGQTWSEPVLSIINYRGTNAAVFIVGGGYDVAYDNGRPASLPAQGAQLFIIAAQDFTAAGTEYEIGDVLWWASSENNNDAKHVEIEALKYSIPSAVKTLDKDGDGFLDHIYVGDMGGQVHRLDIDNSGGTDLVANASNGFADTVIARLGFDGSSLQDNQYQDDRRFFYPPSVSLMLDSRGRRYIGVALGSGWRSNPLNSVVDEKFYYLMDYAPYTGASETVVTDSSVTQSQNLQIQPLAMVDDIGDLADTAANIAADTGIRGYSFALDNTAEKFLGSPLILSGSVYFSTYYRDSQQVSANVCQATTGTAAFYSYVPGSGSALQVADRLNQNAAGSIQAIIAQIEVQVTGEGEAGDTPQRKVKGGLFSGPGSPGSIPMNLDGIRKTRWHRIQE